MNPFQPIRPKCSDDSHGALVSQHGVASGPGRRNISQACSVCREKKTKCDGRKPSCSSCVSLDKICVYENSDKRNHDAWKSAIDDLQQRSDKLESIIESLQCNSFPEAIQRLQQLRADRFRSPQSKVFAVTGSSSGSSSGLNSSNISNCAPRDDDCSHNLSSTSPSTNLPQGGSISMSEQPSNTPGNDCNVRSSDFDYNSLPPQFLTRRAVSAYLHFGSTMFYVMQRGACEKLMRAIYEQPADMTKSDTCGLCAVATVGSLYCTDELPDFAYKKYFQCASLLLQDTVEADALMGMRVSACLSVYLVLGKSTSARTMTASGLNIARWNMRKWMRNASHEDRLEWARVLRTLAFMECWLSSTFGYTFDLGTEEMNLLEELAVSESAENPLKSFCSSLVQFHIFEVGLFSAQILSQAQHAVHLTNYDIEQLSAKLDIWHERLPESLHLRQLVSDNRTNSVLAKRPLFFMHMAHVSSRIVLYERVIQAALNQQTCTSDQSIACQVFGLPEDIHQIYTAFAQQLARIIGLLYEEQCVLTRCPITIHACFHSSVVLLLRAAQNLALGVFRNSALENLSYARTCLLTLEVCKEQDIVAIQLDHVIAPIYQHLRRVADDSTGSMSSQTNNSDGSTLPAQLDDTVCWLVSAMAVPFKELWV